MTSTDIRPEATRASAWIRTLRAAPAATARLVCFPHAGGAASAFSGLARALPPEIDVVAVQYPGRQARRAEPCVEEISAMAAAATAALDTSVPLFLLGHSMGALVAFEAARLLADGRGVVRLFVSAARPPAQDWGEADVDALTDDAIVDGLRLLGGVPTPILDDPDASREVLRVLRADHRALRDYRCASDAIIAAPITVLLGDVDPKSTPTQMRDWARHTDGGYEMRVLAGGHFALLDAPDATSSLLTERIREPVVQPGDARPADFVRATMLRGLGDQLPPLPTDPTALEEVARTTLPPTAFAYVAGNAGSGGTGLANRAALERIQLMPRMLRGVTRPDLSVRLLGTRLPVPVLLAPVAAQAILHPDGELATARAASETGVPLILSSYSAQTMEEVALAAGSAPRWFQLYLPNDRTIGESLVRRAERSGYTALVVTVDATSLGLRPAELDSGSSPFLRGIGIANYTSDPAFRAGVDPAAGDFADVMYWAKVTATPRLHWEDIAWLRRLTSLPILIKGILHPDDARAALAVGADGVIVSNHGARQLDGCVGAVDALPAVRATVGPAATVLVDSGIRTGADVVKALALGADAVLYGRPYAYGLGIAGQAGVEHVLRCLLADIDLALTLTGCAAVSEINEELLF
ncbi:alpha/beta fold hydrolase [Nocardia sp. NPDC060256]|uniref:alpha/beta fold hydrolase n=1 Tax=unclassified Nocardia TaxID=2637762 RepID=UPI0036611514